jgi:hypothetical protein
MLEKLIRISEGSKKYEAGLLIEKLSGSMLSAHKQWLIENLAKYDVPLKYSRTG